MARTRTRIAIVAGLALFAACWDRSVNESTAQQSLQFNGPSGLQLGDMSSATYDFGTVAPGTMIPAPFSFSPADPTDDYTLDSVMGGGNCTAFALSAASGPASYQGGTAEVFNGVDGSCATHYTGSGTPTPCDYEFMVTFTAPSGPTSCNYTWCYTVGGGGEMPDFNPVNCTDTNFLLTLTGSGGGDQLKTDPAPVNFTVNEGSSATTTVDFIVTGASGSVAVSESITGDTAGVFKLAQPTGSGYFASPGAGNPYDLTCNSGINSTGTYTAQLLLSGTGVTGSTTNLSCNIIDSQLQLSEYMVPFGQVVVGMGSQQQVMATSPGAVGPATFALDQAALTAGVTGSGWGGSSTTVEVGSGVSPTITLLWTPPSLGAGSNGVLGTMNVTFMGTMFPVTIDGTPIEAEVLTNPPAIDFGNVCAGATKTDSLVVYNEGNVNIDLTNAQAGTNVFKASIPPTTLIAGNGNQASGNVSLMAPNVTSTMMYSDDVTLTLSSGTAAPVPLSATVLPDGVIPLPSAVDFGNVEAAAVGSSFTLTNCASGGPTLTVDSATLGGTDPGSFALAAPTLFPFTIAPAASQTFSLAMLTGSAGAKTATLTIDYGSGTAQPTVVGLSGTNVAPAKPRDTFYACSTSGGSGGWPIVAALAVCVFAWRRRRG
jgi:hypothetical protein